MNLQRDDIVYIIYNIVYIVYTTLQQSIKYSSLHELKGSSQIPSDPLSKILRHRVLPSIRVMYFLSKNFWPAKIQYTNNNSNFKLYIYFVLTK